MKKIKKENLRIGTWITFFLIPLSGFAIDIYIPSFPAMATDLHISSSVIKLTLTLYLISYGVSQLILGSLIDVYGRYIVNLLALITFISCNLGMITTSNISLIITLRILQGIAIALMMMSRRAFLIDSYEGQQRAQITSMLTVIWSSAPIIAPFAGGYLQKLFGWHSNFIFMAAYAGIALVLELIYGGETIKEKLKFRLKDLGTAYSFMFSAKDFTVGIFVLGVSYSMVMVFSFSIPFLVEHHFKGGAVVTGYCALCSGVAIFIGGFTSKKMIARALYQKLLWTSGLQLIIGLLMDIAGAITDGLLPLLVFMFLMHLLQGFTYNSFFTYCVTKFPQYAGIASGLVSGGSYIVFSLASYLTTSVISIHGQQSLAISYLLLTTVIALTLWHFGSTLRSLKGINE